MTSWTSSYVADLDYTHGFCRELTPELIRFVALAKGGVLSGDILSVVYQPEGEQAGIAVYELQPSGNLEGADVSSLTGPV